VADDGGDSRTLSPDDAIPAVRHDTAQKKLHEILR